MKLRRLSPLLLSGLLLVAAGLCLLLVQIARAQDKAPVPAHSVLVFLDTAPEHYTPQGSYGGGYGAGVQEARRRTVAQARARAHGLTLVDHWPMPMLGYDCYVMAVPEDQPLDDAVQALSHDAGVAWVEPMQTYAVQGQANKKQADKGDPLYRTQPDALEWHLDGLHRIATGRNITIAVIDSAIDVRHPDLAGQVVLTQNFVTGRTAVAESHGTGVAGIIAARAGNGIGIAGVAPGARLLGLRACWQQADASTVCDTLSLAKALYYAIQRRSDVINMSLSGPPDRLLDSLLDRAQSQGITIVGAVDPDIPDGGFPASHPGVVAVIEEGTSAARKAVFSAPGRDVPTTGPGAGWSVVSGSSFAAAHVSGLFALIRERSHRPETGAVLVTGTDSRIDPCATLQRLSGAAACVSDIALQTRP